MNDRLTFATAPGEWRAEREVTLTGVSKVYGDEFAAKEVVKDCSFRIEEGKFTVLIGPSGCGKTTLINLIAGYEQVSAGRITCDGKPIVGPTRDRLGVVSGNRAVSMDDGVRKCDVWAVSSGPPGLS